MNEKLKEDLKKAAESGKDALVNVKEIIKNITKEVMEKSKDEGKDLKTTAGNLFKEIIKALGLLGKDTFEYLKAAGKGFKEGLKESSTDDNNLVKALGSTMLDSLKHLGGAGLYVTKEGAKSLTTVIENLFKKEKDDK